MGNRLRDNRITIRRLTFSAILTALTAVFLYIGGFLEILDISMAALCGLLMQVAVVENTRGWTWSIYIGSCILALSLMPFNFAGWSYLFLYGFYPILKDVIEARIFSKPVRFVLKQAVCLAGGGAMYLILRFLLATENETWPVLILIGGLYLLSFWAYDFLLSRLTVLYVLRLQPKLNLKLK